MTDIQPWTPETGWLPLAARTQLERDLDDTPELFDQLDRHYLALLAAGERNPDRPQELIPIKTQVLDLADRRRKLTRRDGRNPWLVANRALPADDPRRVHTEDLDPPEWVRLEIELMEPRRLGVLPLLESWVRLADEEMWEADVDHRHPLQPVRGYRAMPDGTGAWGWFDTPTVASEALWLRQHLDWIRAQQWVVELAQDLRGVVADLEALVGRAGTPDAPTALSVLDLGELLDVPTKTIYGWVSAGWIDYATDPEGRTLRDDRNRKTLWLTEARPLAEHAKRRRGRKAAAGA